MGTAFQKGEAEPGDFLVEEPRLPLVYLRRSPLEGQPDVKLVCCVVLRP